jgi:exosome complex component CSL4
MGSKPVEQKTGQLVLPGERLGVIEEFVPDAGTFVKDGVIYSKVVGHTLLDLTTRRVSVHQVGRQALIPKVGSIVMGQVAGGQSDSVNVRIFQIGDKQISNVFVGVLHVSDANIRYVDSMRDVCKAGDIVRARVISDKNQVYHLSTKDRDFGVVYAFCSNCGGTLEPRRESMHCPKCGRIEERKAAADYGKGLI